VKQLSILLLELKQSSEDQIETDCDHILSPLLCSLDESFELFSQSAEKTVLKRILKSLWKILLQTIEKHVVLPSGLFRIFFDLVTYWNQTRNRNETYIKLKVTLFSTLAVEHLKWAKRLDPTWKHLPCPVHFQLVYQALHYSQGKTKGSVVSSDNFKTIKYYLKFLSKQSNIGDGIKNIGTVSLFCNGVCNWKYENLFSLGGNGTQKELSE